MEPQGTKNVFLIDNYIAYHPTLCHQKRRFNHLIMGTIFQSQPTDGVTRRS
jgi:hypothetical protein